MKKSYNKSNTGSVLLNLIFIIIMFLAYNMNAYAQGLKKLKKDKIKAGTEINSKTKGNINTPPGKESKKNGKKNKVDEVENKKAEYIEKTLDYGIQKERKDAIKKIILIKDESLRKKLAGKLIQIIDKEPDAGVKINAIYMLGKLKAKEGTAAIIKKLDDDSEDVQIAAVYSLKTLDGISSKDKLIKMLKNMDMSKDSNLTEGLIQALGHFKSIEIIDFAKKTIEHNKTTKIIRGSLVLFLGKIESKDSKDILLGLYKNPEENLNIRSYAVNSLARLNIKEAKNAINEFLNTMDSYPVKKRKKYYVLKMYSIAALVRLGDKAAVSRLINSLKSNNPSVRLKSIRLIKELKDKRTIDILKYKIKYDQSIKVRKAAKEALKEIEASIKKEKNIKKTKPKDSKKPGK